MTGTVDARALVRVTAAGLVCLGAGISATGMFSGGRDELVVAGAVVVGCAVVAGFAALMPRLPGRARLAGAFIAVLAGALLVLAPGAALVDGPRRLLTGALPLDPAGPELAAVALLVGLAAAIGAELALVPRRLPVAAVPGLAAQAVLLWVAAAGPTPPLAAAGISVLGCGLLLAGLAPRPRPTAAVASPRLAGASADPGRRAVVPLILTSAVVVAAVTAGTLLLSPDLPGRDLRAEPANARDLVDEPVDLSRATSPLSRFPALQTGADRVLFLVRTSGQPDETLRVRWATLDRFDGTTWTTRASFQRAGRNLPPGPSVAARHERVQTEVRVSDTAGVLWLPSIGRPVHVSVPGLGVDPRSGDLAVPVDAAVPDHYTVTGDVTRFAALDLRSAVGEPAPQSSYDVPPALTGAAQAAVAGATTSFGRLAALESFFATDGGFGVATGADAPAGHGIFQISRLLKEKTGTAEQYSSAFAVLARVLGFDSRVVIGFRAATETSGDLRGTAVVRTRSVDAWPEIRLRDLGWVRFAPTPTRTTDPSQQTGSSSGDPDVEKAVAQEQQARSGGPQQPAPAPPTAADSGTPWWVVVLSSVAGLVLLALIALLFVPVAKVVRRWRRRGRPEAAGRLLGAWQEVLDRLTDHRIPASPDLSRPEVARASALHSADLSSSIPPLARLADTVGFSGTEPDPGLDDLAWQHADQARSSLRKAASLWGRFAAAFDPRSLLRHR